MKSCYYRLLFLFLCTGTIITSGCSPEPIHRLQADHDDILMYQGMEYLQSDLESSTVILAYYRHINNQVIMDLEIENYGEEPVRVGSENFGYKGYRIQNDSTKLNLIASRAMDPEKVILNIDRSISREKADENTRLVMGAIGTTLSIAADVASAGDGTTPEEKERRAQAREQEAYRRHERRDEYYQTVSTLNGRRNYWETETLRTTDLFPGESIAGEIRFPRVSDDIEYLEITIIVGEDEHQFNYFQKTY